MHIGKFAILITILSGLIYQVCLKLMSDTFNPMHSLVFTYLSSLIGIILILVINNDFSNFSFEKSFSLTSIFLGLAIVGIEIGVIFSYKNGWNLIFTPIIVTICITLLLIPIGVYFFSEGFSFIKLFGIILCLIGLSILKI